MPGSIERFACAININSTAQITIQEEIKKKITHKQRVQSLGERFIATK